jgi:hypothetical protein
MLIGYARVSTAEQNLDLQTDALTKAGCERIFTDTAGGAKSERPGLAEALNFMREGDTLVVWKLDRLGRSLKHLIETCSPFKERRKAFEVCKRTLIPAPVAENCFFTSLGRWPNLSGTLSAIGRRLDWRPREVGVALAAVRA